jgi:hypothetical protein
MIWRGWLVEGEPASQRRFSGMRMEGEVMGQDEILGGSSAPSTEAATRQARSRRPTPRLAGLIAGGLLVLALAALGGCSGIALLTGSDASTAAPAGVGGDSEAQAPTAPLWRRTVVSNADLENTSGVRIVFVAVSGGGGLVDLRFQVVNPDKAAYVHDDTYPPAVIDQSTGLVVDELLMGHFHASQYNPGQTYYLIFENPGSLVRRGNKVSVLLGDAEVDDVIVQ